MITKERIKKVLAFAVFAMAMLVLTGVSAKADVFSLNFYYYPWPWSEDMYDTITLNTNPEDGDQYAGAGDWLTNGWQDIVVPWAETPPPKDPITITSANDGDTATYTLTNARNGGAYFWGAPRTTLPGDGNADMMDGHSNGTEDGASEGTPSLPDEITDMTISDIPYPVYDVIFYIGGQEAQFYDGKGKFVFNGVEQDFTLKSGVFDANFIEIVDGNTPGNYIAFEDVRGSSFRVQIWGNGFAHIGLCGLQFSSGHSFKPSPAHEEMIAVEEAGDVKLSWTNMEPNEPGNPVYVDVWYGTEPNKLPPPDPDYDFNLIVDADVDGQDVNSVGVGSLGLGKYYWRVNSYIYGSATGDYVEGPMWYFLVVYDLPPEVNAGIDMITWSGQEVQLEPTVVDDGKSELHYLWSAAPEVGVVFDPNKFVKAPKVTITRNPGSVLIPNYGFEDRKLADGASPYLSGFDSWGWFDNDYTGIWNPAEPNEAPEGWNVGYAQPYNGVPSGLAQILTDTLAAETTYTLTVEVGNTVGMNWGGYKVQLLAGGSRGSGSYGDPIMGGTVIAQDTNGQTIAEGVFKTSTVTHTTGSVTDPNVGLPIQIRLLAIGTNETYEVDFDDVQLIANPPHPLSPEPHTVELTLAVNDEGDYPAPVRDKLEIDVYHNACLAAYGAGETNIGDVDHDCDTDLEDLAEIAKEWLNDYSLTVAIVKP